MFADLMMSGDSIFPLTSVNTCMSSSCQHLSTPACHRAVNIRQHQHVIAPSTSVNNSIPSSRQHLSKPACHRPVNICQHQHAIVPSTFVNTSRADLVGKIKIFLSTSCISKLIRNHSSCCSLLHHSPRNHFLFLSLAT